MSSLLIIATGNQHKVDEIGAILSPAISCVPMRVLGDCPELKETGTTFEENATMKATQLAEWLASGPNIRFPVDRFDTIRVLADDSGLEVDALKGAPGVYSARFATPEGSEGNASDHANNEKLMRLMANVPEDQRNARFRCVLALLDTPYDASRPPHLFSGHCEGKIAKQRHGTEGFGYDPLFYPEGHELSFGQLGSDVKNRISHRAVALEKLAQHLK